MSLLPSKGPETSGVQEGELEVVGVDEDVAPILDALSSDTARAVLNSIYEQPGTPSEVADRLDMSIQKVSYHIENLAEEDLIAVAGTRYSEKGQEMKVYEPPEDPLVLFVGTRERKESLLTMVKRVLPVVGGLGIGSVVINRVSGGGSLLPSFGMASQGGADGGAAPPTDGSDDAEAAQDGAGGDGGADAGSATTDGEGTSLSAEADAETTPTPESDGGDMGIAEATSEPTATEAPAETPMPTEAPTEVPAATPTEAADVATETARITAESAGAAISPGAAFFLGGLLVLSVVVAWWGYRNYA